MTKNYTITPQSSYKFYLSIKIGKTKHRLKGKFKMKNLKGFSALLVIAPIFFMGCVAEKTTSIKPLPTKKEIVVLDTNKTLSKKEKLLASAIFGGEISLEHEEEKQHKIQPLVEHTQPILTTPTLQLAQEWEAFSKEDEILETARNFLGVKYIWAANGPSAFDCSGFTKYVFKKSGIALPRYSGHQANVGKKIAFKDLEKGDLVFFDTEKKFTRTVNHVGIFIGNNKFIHASSAKKKVIITSFSKKKFYKNKFLYARRIINNNDNLAFNTKLKQNNVFN
ncbi:MAG: Invasion associated protein p60 [uncultured Sulfurovum sp.]|uniref:Invasion associated protein p60 n=1 Tax=uncultured Sulfurovum sp. TaxID=269237 RepID=A0A6S6SIP0_9BACT|nr:MAG: Invasion associated protein p60 [uncultured Sulfurovum sp.]